MLRTTLHACFLTSTLLASACVDDLGYFSETLETDPDGTPEDDLTTDESPTGDTPDDEGGDPTPWASDGHGIDDTTPDLDPDLPLPPGRILAWGTPEEGALTILATASPEIDGLLGTAVDYGIWLDDGDDSAIVYAIDDGGEAVWAFGFAAAYAPDVSGTYQQAGLWSLPLDIKLPPLNCYAPPCPGEEPPLGSSESPYPDHFQMGVSPGGFDSYGTMSGLPFGVAATFDADGVVDHVENTESGPLLAEDYQRLAIIHAIMSDLAGVFDELTVKVDGGEIEFDELCAITDAAAWLEFVGRIDECCIQWIGDVCVACPGPVIPEIGIAGSC